MKAFTPSHETVLENPYLDFHVWYRESQNTFIPPHFHDALELEFFPSGSSQLYIRNQLHQLTAGQWGVINPNVVHTTTCLHTNTCLLLMFPSSLLQRMVSDYDRRELLMPQELPVHPALAQLNLAATALIEALECSCPEQNLTVTRRALDILSLFYAYFSRPSDSAYQFRGDERLFDLLGYAAEHDAEPLSVSDAARLCHLQPEYFCRYFKQKTGETFLTYLTRLRLAHVLSDLKRSDDSIQRIAERNGFSNQKSFIRAFRAQFGCTPTELRTRLREGPTLYALQNCSPRFVTG